MTSISLYSKLLFLPRADTTDLAVSQSEQLARVKSVRRALCCSNLEDALMAEIQ